MERKLKILLAEDEELCQRLFRRYLERLGYDVVAASDGVEALQLFEAESPDLLLSDVDMPGMTGLELLSQIRMRQASLPAILVSGKGVPEGRSRGAAAYTFLAKPINFSHLANTIRHAIAS